MYKTQKLDATGQAPISRDRRRPFMDAKSPRAVETLNVRTGESWILERFTVECSGGQAAGALLVVDEATRRPIAIEVDVAIGAQHLVDTLNHLRAVRGNLGGSAWTTTRRGPTQRLHSADGWSGMASSKAE
jgi:hypothetical protein